MPIVRTEIIDKNGVVTHRNKRTSATNDASSRITPNVSASALQVKKERPITDASILANNIKARHPGVVLHFTGSQYSGYATLDTISIPKEMRGQGIASQIMQELIDEADANGWNMALTPSSDFGSSKARLVKFYSRFGFVPNSGINKDYSTSEIMLRMADN